MSKKLTREEYVVRANEIAKKFNKKGYLQSSLDDMLDNEAEGGLSLMLGIGNINVSIDEETIDEAYGYYEENWEIQYGCDEVASKIYNVNEAEKNLAESINWWMNNNKDKNKNVNVTFLENEESIECVDVYIWLGSKKDITVDENEAFTVTRETGEMLFKMNKFKNYFIEDSIFWKQVEDENE